MALSFLNCCKKKESGPENNTINPTPVNLISNSSFEINGQHSLTGWILNADSYSFSYEAPPGGGFWSLALPTGGMPFPNTIETMIPAPIGINNYKFSVYGKKKFNEAGGEAFLFIKHADSLIISKTLGIKDTAWTFYFTNDTIYTVLGDSLCVRLLTPPEPGDPFYVVFDLCKLEKLN